MSSFPINIAKRNVWTWILVVFGLSPSNGFGQHDKANTAEALHEATALIFERLCQTQVTENRGDTLYFESPESGSGRPHGALLLDQLYPLASQPGRQLGVFRIFKVTNRSHDASSNGSWEAVTYLGTGRGYQVQFGLAYFQREQDQLTLTELDMEVGLLGEGFELPEWTIHEFQDGDNSPWGAMVFVNHSWRLGFGHSTLSVVDLGGQNHHQFTLFHSLEAQRDDSYWSFSTKPSDWTRVKQIWDDRYATTTDPERRYECNLEWKFEDRTLIIEEHPTYQYFERLEGVGNDQLLDSIATMPIKRYAYRESFWPERYMIIEEE